MAAGAGVKQELIVQTALTLLDEVGLEGLHDAGARQRLEDSGAFALLAFP